MFTDWTEPKTSKPKLAKQPKGKKVMNTENNTAMNNAPADPASAPVELLKGAIVQQQLPDGETPEAPMRAFLASYKKVKHTDKEKVAAIKVGCASMAIQPLVDAEGVSRPNVEVLVPVYSMEQVAEHPKGIKFLEQVLAAATDSAMKKLYLDQYKVAPAVLTLTEIIEANMRTGRSAVASKELLEKLASVVHQVLEHSNVPAGTIATFKALIMGKFDSGILGTFSKIQNQFAPALKIIETCIDKVQDESIKLQLLGVHGVLVANYENWVTQSEVATLDMDALAGLSL